MKDYLNMIEKVFMNMKDYIDKGRFICVNIGREWGPINIAAKYDNIFEGLGYTFFRNIYWSKPKGAARGTITTRNPFPRYYVPKVQTEIIEIYASEEMPNIYEPMIVYKIGEGEKTRKEQIPKILLEKYSGNVLEMMTETQLSQDHPAPFPVQLPYNCIRFFSFEGERIIDPFMGSGSTLIAADQLKRKCYGIELDPSYVSLCIERFMLYKPSAKMDIQRTVDPKEKVL
jgi:site-specific DNA-methyltransferase (adenine-specific)